MTRPHGSRGHGAHENSIAHDPTTVWVRLRVRVSHTLTLYPVRLRLCASQRTAWFAQPSPPSTAPPSTALAKAAGASHIFVGSKSAARLIVPGRNHSVSSNTSFHSSFSFEASAAEAPAVVASSCERARQHARGRACRIPRRTQRSTTRGTRRISWGHTAHKAHVTMRMGHGSICAPGTCCRWAPFSSGRGLPRRRSRQSAPASWRPLRQRARPLSL